MSLAALTVVGSTTWSSSRRRILRERWTLRSVIPMHGAGGPRRGTDPPSSRRVTPVRGEQAACSILRRTPAMSRFQELISSGQPVLVDVHAEWCGLQGHVAIDTRWPAA